jgi:hypothetical protein
MANVYAVKTGNWSDPTVWNTGALPTPADDVFSNNFTVTIDQNVSVLSIRNRAASPAVAGGGFVISSAVTVTVTGASTGIMGGSGSCITFSGAAGVTATINTSRIEGPDTNASQTINHTGSGTLTITCSSYSPSGAGSTRYTILFNSTGVLNYSGGAIVGFFSTQSFGVLGAGTLNIVANISGGSNTAGLDIGAAATINITGDIYGGTNSGRGISVSASCILNITGTIRSSTQGPGINVNSSSPQINVTGNVLPEVTSNQAAINCQSFNSYLKIVGTITASTGSAAVVSTSGGAINIFTGPFISSTSGILPLYVTRMHYQRTLGSYYEFRDNSTGGALPPAASAPATRLVAPGTPIDSPLPANVRQGIVYASGSLTGTMVVPSPSNVANNVPVDNTVGTAVLDPNAIWSVPLTSINTLNSIGRRVKNAATVETTGAQLESLIRANE